VRERGRRGRRGSEERWRRRGSGRERVGEEEGEGEGGREEGAALLTHKMFRTNTMFSQTHGLVRVCLV